MSTGDEDVPGAPPPGETICAACGGSGLLDGGACPECDGEGRIKAVLGDT